MVLAFVSALKAPTETEPQASCSHDARRDSPTPLHDEADAFIVKNSTALG
jgi:hypothetical protein